LNFAKTGELIYSKGKSSCGKKGVIISNPEGIGQHVFVSDAKNDTTIRTTIKDDEKCPLGKDYFVSIAYNLVGFPGLPIPEAVTSLKV
jgi:hypothetical protein